MTAVQMTVGLRSIDGTGACAGWAGPHTITVDRPEGKAGGTGRGFNGGQLLALAIGGCFCNDLHYVAHDMGLKLSRVAVDVTLTLEGSPLIATSATMQVNIEAEQPVDTRAIIQRAAEISTVANSLARGLKVAINS
jgi:organic hydroperoxide reductase OsmC/OhrA